MADVLAQFKQWMSIDKQESAEDRAKDEEYQENTWEWYKKAQEDKLGFYWKFPENNNEDSDNSEVIENKENLSDNIDDEKIDENPNSPLIDSFINQWLITLEEWNSIKGVLITSWNTIESIRSLDWIDEEKKEQVIDSIKFLDWEWAKKYSVDKFNKDFEWEIEWLKTSVEWKEDWEKELSNNKQDLVNRLWWNYFSIWNPEGWEETDKEALDKAFKITLNSIITDWGESFKRPDEFNTMKGVINNNDLSFKERFDELSKIDNLVINSKSRSLWKQSKEFKNMKKWVETKKLSLSERFNDYKKQVDVATQENQQKKLEELQIKLWELSIEADSSWDIFVASDIDTLVDEINENLKEA